MVGGASGALAKTISAYDMAVSDAIYGKDKKYVSQARLRKMLDYEFDLMVERLGVGRGDKSSFFAFANTVAARTYQGNDECHGWLGIKFQAEPKGVPSEIVLHVNMLDKENLQQQEALGIIGVNLAYGAFYLNAEPEKLIASARPSTERISGYDSSRALSRRGQPADEPAWWQKDRRRADRPDGEVLQLRCCGKRS